MQLRIKYMISGIVVLLVLLLCGMGWHQHTHFNRNATVNGVAVGGLNAQQAYQKVKAAKRANKVYLNGHLVYTGHSTGSGITSQDQAKFKTALQKQATFFPSGKRVNVTVEPTNVDKGQQTAMWQAVNAYVQRLNRGRKAPVDAYALLSKGKVTTVAAKQGTQYNVASLHRQFNRKAANGTIKLTAHHR